MAYRLRPEVPWPPCRPIDLTPCRVFSVVHEARVAAPGSAPFLTAAATAANIQSQAMMQRMLAAMLRQEAARIAHENAVRKRHGILTAKIRQGISDILRRP